MCCLLTALCMSLINTGGLQLTLELFSMAGTSLPPAALIWGDGSPHATSSSTGGNIECTFKKPSKRNGPLKHKKAIKKRVH